MAFFWNVGILAAVVAIALVVGPVHPVSAAGEAAYKKARTSFEADNLTEAVHWLEKAVKQGHQAAQLPLAAMYRDGHGVDQDYKRALALFTRAAKYGYPSAQFSLGVMYRLGEGVKRDYVEAIKWYRMAATQGDADSQNSLGIMYESGRGIKLDIIKAYMWYEVAAENGNKRGDVNRKRLSRSLSSDELPKAKKLSITCLSSKYKSCD